MENKSIEGDIVIVDDSIMFAETLHDYIKSCMSKSSSVFSDPIEALEYVNKSEVSLLITDYDMPKLNGVELVKKVHEVNKGIRLCVMSGHCEEYLKSKVENSGISFFVNVVSKDNLKKIEQIIKNEV